MGDRDQGSDGRRDVDPSNCAGASSRAHEPVPGKQTLLDGSFPSSNKVGAQSLIQQAYGTGGQAWSAALPTGHHAGAAGDKHRGSRASGDSLPPSVPKV